MATQVWVCSQSHRLKVQEKVKDPKKNGPPCRKTLPGGKVCGLPTKAKWQSRVGDKIQRFSTKKEAEDWEDEQKTKKPTPTTRGEERLIYWPEAREIFEHYIDARLIVTTAKEKAELKARKEREVKSPILHYFLSPQCQIEVAENPKPIAQTTRRSYLIDLAMLEQVFSGCSLQELRIRMVQDWQRDYERSGYSPNNLNRVLVTLKSILKRICTISDGMEYPKLRVVKDYICTVKPRPRRAHKVLFLEDDEWPILLKHCSTPQLRHFVFGILNTGLRHSDMLKLKRSEIDFRAGVITTLVKGRKEVHIPLTQEYRKYLLENWFVRNKLRSINDYLIPSKENPANCYTLGSGLGFDRAREKAAKEAEANGNDALAAKFRATTPHTLRHTFATHFIYKTSREKGVDTAVHMLSEILGHSSLAITRVYTHFIQRLQQEAMDNYSAGMFDGFDTSTI